MSKIVVNKFGEMVEHSPNNSFLEMIWHKSFNEIYCHHADFYIPKSDIDYANEDTVKIIVKRIENNIIKGEVKSSIIKNITNFIHLKVEGDTIKIPLHSSEILDALCEIKWTRKKNGEKGVIKFFPLSISIGLQDKKRKCYQFEVASEKFPLTVVEKHFDDLKDGEKIETVIYLD